MKAKDVGREALHTTPALILGVSGLAKLTGASTDQFAAWGYPRWWAYVTGATEIAAAGLLANDRTSLIGGGLASGVLAGAVATHLMHRELPNLLFPAVVGAITAASVWQRRARALPTPRPRDSFTAQLDAERRAIEGVATGEL